MTINTKTPNRLDHPPVPVQAKLAAAWASFMFLYIYVDILNFYKPGVVDSILNGLMWRFEVTPTLVTIAFVSVSIPAVMVMASVTLPARANRATNLIVATLLIPYSIFNAAGATWEWVGFYAISIGVELLLLAFILRSAWAWPRTGAVQAATATDLRRVGTR